MMFALLLNQVLVALVFGAGHEYSDADQTLLFESSLQADCIVQIWAEKPIPLYVFYLQLQCKVD